VAIIGAHALLYTSEPDAVRALLRDVFGFKHVDAGAGWLIFALPPAELGVHPAEGPTYESGVRHQLTFMCDDIQATIRDLRSKGVDVKGEPQDESFGITVMLDLPGGVEVMLYEPRHATAIETTAH
jgi:catechol 2,3-dioxygenase-like lactoylglutathione lyase family enzyme